MFNIPNLLTLSRMAFLPIIIGLLFVPEPWAVWTALGLYIVTAISDFLDGYLARTLDQVSDLGIFLDPITDKIFVSALMIALVGFDRLEGIWMIPAIVIIMREFLISGLREYLGGKNIKVPVSKLAKWKTAAQMTAIGFLIVGPAVPFTLEIGQWGLAAAAVLTVVTGWNYLIAGLKHISP